MISTQEKVKNLQQAITKQDSPTIFQLSKQLLKDAPNDQQYQQCYIISGIKAKKFDELSSTILKQQPTSQKLNTLYFYYLYSSTQYKKCIQLLKSRKLSTNMKLLLAQSYFNLLQYENCIKLLIQLMKQLKLSQQERETYMIDILAANTSENTLSNIKQYEYLINQNSCKELFYNYSLCKYNTGAIQESLKYLNMFQASLTKQKQDEVDQITVKLFKDYIKMRNHSEYSNKIWDQRIQQYENMLKIDRDDNLKTVLLNNMLFLKGIYHDEDVHNFKILDDCLDIHKNKLSEKQRYYLKLNKITLMLRRSKYSDALKLLKELQSTKPNKQLLYSDYTFIRNKYFALKKNKQYGILQQFIKDIEKFDENLGFCLMADLAKQRGDHESMLKKLQDSTNWKNQVLKNYIFSLLIKDQAMFQKYSEYLGDLAAKSNQINILEILLKLYQNKNDTIKQKNILNRMLEISPSHLSTKIKLANIQLNQGNNKYVENMLRGIQMPEQITDPNFLQYIQKNIHISKKEEIPAQQQQDFKKQPNKKRIKKKKKSRLPKNIQKYIQGYKPDPQRWLPKWQRKGYKKRGKKANKTQGMVMVGKQERNNYATGASTSAKQVTKQTKKRR